MQPESRVIASSPGHSDRSDRRIPVQGTGPSGVSHRDIIENYLSIIPGEEFTFTSEHARELGPLKPDRKFSICIPVAAHEECEHVAKTLHAFSSQSIGKEYFEVCLFLNYPKEKETSHWDKIQSSWDAALRGQRETGLDVRILVRSITNGTIGYIRKLLDDAMLLRTLEAGKSDHLLLRTDADLLAVNPNLLKCYLNVFSRCHDVIAARGRLDYDFPSMLSEPLVLFGWRLLLVLSCIDEHRNGRPATGGANFVSPAWINAIAGGYNPNMTCGEDVNLGARILETAGSYGRFLKCGSGTTIWTSGRRAWAATARGWCPAMQWSIKATGFDIDDNGNIRQISFDRMEEAAFVKLLEPHIFVGDAGETVAETLDIFSRESSVRQALADRAGRFMGFKYDDVSRKMVSCDQLMLSLRKQARLAIRRWPAIVTA